MVRNHFHGSGKDLEWKSINIDFQHANSQCFVFPSSYCDDTLCDFVICGDPVEFLEYMELHVTALLSGSQRLVQPECDIFTL